jgi:hypothetical protein
MAILEGIASLFAEVFSTVYEKATVETWSQTETRDPETGSFSKTLVTSNEVFVQLYTDGEYLRLKQGDSRNLQVSHSTKELYARMLVVSGPLSLDSESFLIVKGLRYSIRPPITLDPASSHWTFKCLLVEPE